MRLTIPMLQAARKYVIPAKAGIQRISSKFGHWIPAFAGTTEDC